MRGLHDTVLLAMLCSSRLWRHTTTALTPLHRLLLPPTSFPYITISLAAGTEDRLDEQEDTHYNSKIEDDDNDSDNHQLSKVKWKKKRFLMLKDVNAAIHKGDPRAGRKAQDVVKRMWQLYEVTGGDPDFAPNVQVYNLLIHALAKEKKRTANNNNNHGARAQAVLHEMVQRGVTPNVVSYTSVMDAYASQAAAGDVQAPAAAEAVLMEWMARSERDSALRVTAVTADVVLNAWAQQGTWEGAVRAQEILERLETLGTGITRDDDSSLRPTVHSYATVIHGWAQAGGGTAAAERAERILQGMMRRDEADKVVAPDTVVVNAVIDAWSSSGDARAGTKALALLNQMKELHQSKGYDCAPDLVTYNTVLSAWSHSGHVNAASKAEQILQSMMDAHKTNPQACPAPNTVSYNCVLHAWSRSASAAAHERAEKILQYMIQSDDDQSIAPDVYSFTSVLTALAKSKAPHKAARARAYLDRMIQMYTETKQTSLAPTQVPFNAVLNAAAFSALGTPEQEQRQALKTAVETFSLMKRRGISPDTISYGNMLKVVANLIPRGKIRTEMGLQLFQACCQDGLVGELVWNEARRALPGTVLNKVVGGHRKPLAAIQVRHLPRSWTQKVPQPRRLHTKPQKNKESSSPKEEDPAEARRREPLRKFRNISEQSYQSGRDV